MIGNKNKSKGRLEVICGSMFSGKTEELIKRLKRAALDKEKFVVFKPKTDSRSPKNKIISHGKNEIGARVVENAQEIYSCSKNYDVIGIDEAQFFVQDLVAVCNKLANDGCRVIVSGLDMDYKGNPFGPMPNLMACAEEITKVHAVCIDTGELANYSYRKNTTNDLILVGEKKEYEPLSRSAFIKRMEKREKKK